MRTAFAIWTLGVCLACSLPAESSIQVVSLNLASRKDATEVERSLSRDAELAQADIYLFQEVYKGPEGSDSIAAAIARVRKYQVAFAPANQAVDGGDIGLAIVSRYPLRNVEVVQLPHYELPVRSRFRIALAAQAETEFGLVDIINVHLDTRINLEERLKQLQPVMDRVASSQNKVIIGGDFNTNPHAWFRGIFPLPFAGRQASKVYSTMLASGFVSSLPLGTVTHDIPGMQLDWVFSKALKPTKAHVLRMRQSDHHAVIAQLEVPR